MKKRRILLSLLSLFMATGVLLTSGISKKDNFAANAETYVGGAKIGWNNVDYYKPTTFAPDCTPECPPQSGYCLLVLYDSNIASTTYTTQNLLSANIPGCNVGDYILVNGVPCKNVTDVLVYCYPQNGFYIYVPDTSFSVSDAYECLTINVLQGMSIDGAYKTIASTFEYQGDLGTFNNWVLDPVIGEKTYVKFDSIDWNNTDYSHLSTNPPWCGDLNGVNAPKNGYCMLAFFKEENKTVEGTFITAPTTTGRGVIGKGLSPDTKIKVNGVNIVDVEGAKCYIYPQYGIYFYIPESSITYNDTYQIPVIKIEEGLHFKNKYVKPISFEFRGELGERGCWTYVKEESEYNKFQFVDVAGGWNNVAADSLHRHSILQFGQHGVNYLKEDKVANGANLVSKYSDCGKKISLNGVPLYQLDEAVVSYLHGYCYVYIAFATADLVPSNGYKVVTLHFEQNTNFYDTLLPELTLYLFNNEWTTEQPETPDDSDYLNVTSFSNIYGVNSATLNDENNTISATKQTSINELKMFFDYSVLNEDTSFSLYALGTNNQNGLRLAFSKNTITLYDCTEGNALLGSASISPFTYDDWYSVLFYTKVDAGKLHIFVAVDDVTYIHASDVLIGNESNLGNLFTITVGSGSATLKNATYGADNKKPVITYTGKEVYGVSIGSEKIDFANKVSSFDAKDGDISNKIVITWENGALTNDLVNEGTWKVEFSSSDKAGNTSKYYVTVIATNKLDVVVTFDGKNPVNYRIGDHIACVADPVKTDENKLYRFIGWYYNDKLWDFEIDYVVGDMNLESKFQETYEEYRITFNVEGLKDTRSFDLYFGYGTVVNLEIFNRDGYTLKSFVDDVEVDSITVRRNMDVKLVYTSLNPETSDKSEEDAKNGCKGSLETCSTIILLISGAAIALLALRKAKGGKEHE